MTSRSTELTLWVREHLAAVLAKEDFVSAREIADLGVATFDATFFQELGMEKARGIIHDEVLKVIAQRRRGKMPEVPATAASVAERKLTKAARTWGDFLEYNGRHHIKYMKMTYDDLMNAARIRRSRGEHEIHLASLHELVAARLTPGSSQVVEDVMTEEDVETLSSGIQVRYGITWEDLLGKQLAMVRRSTSTSEAAD